LEITPDATVNSFGVICVSRLDRTDDLEEDHLFSRTPLTGRGEEFFFFFFFDEGRGKELKIVCLF
jgi:hypothetical protein